MISASTFALKIGFVSASLSSRAGGLAASMPATVNALTRRGLSVSVFGLQDQALDLSDVPYEAADVQAISAWPTPGVRLAPRLDGALSEAKLDLLHLQGLWLYPSIATLRWRLCTSRPVIISPHGMLDPWALRNSAWKKQLALAAFERANLKGASCLHALNASELESFRAFGLRNPVAVIPNGVDLPPNGPIPPRPKFMDGDDRSILLFLGRIHPKKGLAETLDAWARALAIRPSLACDWVLVLAGWDDGGHLEGLRRRAAELGVEESVRFPGAAFGTDKAALLQHAGAFILASHSEGLPMGVLEAWAHRVPVMMTRACNLPEAFSAGAAVEISTNPEEMSTVIIRTLYSPERFAMGDAGYSLAAEQFGWGKVARDFHAVYHWLIEQGPPPACVQTKC